MPPELHIVGHAGPKAGWSVPAHAHAREHETVVILRGRFQVTVAGQVLVGGRGEVFFYRAGTLHLEQALGREPLETLYLSFYANPVPALPLRCFDRQGRIEHQIRWLFELFPAADLKGKAAQNALLRTLLYAHAEAAHCGDSRLLLQTKRYIQSHLSGPLHLDDLAQNAGMSRFYFARSFCAAAGESPARYVRRMRIAAAKGLLLRTRLPLRSVAQETGFGDEFHFCRVFRRMEGLPPGAFRSGRQRRGPTN